MVRGTVALLLSLTALPAAAQDVVRLRSGRLLSGVIAVDPADKDGFRLTRWDTGGIVYVRWTQLPEIEKGRLLNKSAESSPAGELLDGLRVLTPNREVVGTLVKEDAAQIQVKTKDARVPMVIPVTAILRRDAVRVREADVYGPEEMIEARAANAGETDYEALVGVGRFAQGLKLYECAREYYRKAAAADPSRKEEIDPMLAANESLIQEAAAVAMLAAIRKLVEETEYDKAIESAEKLASTYPETEVAKQNSDLVTSLQKEAKDFETRRAEILAQKVPDMYRFRRMSLLSQYASGKYKLSEARAMAGRIDDEIMKELAKKLKSTPEDIAQAWQKRDSKNLKTVGYGSGSWIAKGGQDGGPDDDGGGAGNNAVDNFTRQFGDRRRQAAAQQRQAAAAGRNLQKSEEWWAGATSAERRNWLEAEYANTSANVKKEEKQPPRKCSYCAGEGTLRTNRNGVVVNVKCPRCHGVKEDMTLQYW